jgi:hypothetical protein
MSNPLEERRAQRFQFLHAVYEESEGSAGRLLRFSDIAEKLGIDEGRAREIVGYLIGERLLEWGAMGMIELTHWGLKEVEAALLAPDEPTEHFPPFVVAENYMHIGSISHSQIQQGTTASRQAMNLQEADELRTLVADVRAALVQFRLGEEEQQGVEADLATIEIQLGSAKPKVNVVRESLSSTRAVLEGALGGTLANAAPQLPGLVERIGHAISGLA